jgi:hypothetical protein
MHFIRDLYAVPYKIFMVSCVSSATALGVALPPASMQSCARCFLALTKKLLFLDAPIKMELKDDNKET